ncbi:MAG: AbrB/MazE/SpoVT family DNA-binding domain-containing protein [Halobacteria archaeon]
MTVTLQASRVQRVGNSRGIILPRKVLSHLGWREGDPVFLSTDGRRLAVSRDPGGPIGDFLDAIRDILGTEVRQVRLLGSYGTPRYRPGESDIDLYIETRSDTPGIRNRLHRAAVDAGLKHGVSFDLTLLTAPQARRSERLGVPYLREVRRGTLLYGA